jgi:peroxiredoxin
VSTQWRLVGVALLFGLAIGCGQSGSPSPAPATANVVTATNDSPTELPPASIALPSALAESPTATSTAPEEGSPQWLLQQIQRIRLLPLPATPDTDDEEPSTDTAANPDAAGSSAEEIKDRLAKTRALRRERNLEIVKLATEALTLTAKDPQQEPVFLAAVSNLLDARLQLALQGDEESVTALYDWTEALHERRPDSPAAAEAQLTLVNLAHAHTLRYAQSEPRWLQEFSRQAQLFATRFPNEQARTLPLLLAAGRTCELHNLFDEAKSCYGLIHSKFPESQQARQCEGILRRLGLVGQPLQFAGPTLDGNFLSIDSFAGKSVVIVFWASHVTTFHDQIGTLQAVMEKYKKYAQVLSVSLDSEEAEIDAFLEKTKLNWPVVFHVEPDKRGWNAPLAVHYGITTLPTIWIVDPKGVVAETHVTAETLQPKLHEVIRKHLNASGSRAVKTSETQTK